MPSSPPPGFGDVLRAAERAYTGLPITLEDPTPEDEKSDVRRFTYSGPEWAIRGQVRDEASGPRLLSLEIRAAEPDGAVSASLVRNVPVGQITASLRILLTLDRARRDGVSYNFPSGPPPGYKYTPLVDDPPKQPRRGGKPAVTEDRLRAVAEAYLAETAPGKPAHPLGRLAEQFGSPQETVRTWISRARREGWLAPGVKGRAGGEPGPKLLSAQLEDIKRENPGLISHSQVDAEGNVTDESGLE